MEKEWVWENLANEKGYTTNKSRMKVPGGWVYKETNALEPVMVYIPDPGAWKNNQIKF